MLDDALEVDKSLNSTSILVQQHNTYKPPMAHAWGGSHDVSTEFLLSIGKVGMVSVFIPTFIISLTCIT